MNSKLMSIDAKPPAELFGHVFTDYLKGLSMSTMKDQCMVMTEIWCHSGKTGIVRLRLCLYWQAEYSGARNDWKHNMRCVEDIFKAILAEPTQ